MLDPDMTAALREVLDRQAIHDGTSVSPLPGIPDTAAMPGNYIDPRIPELDAHSADIVRLLGLN